MVAQTLYSLHHAAVDRHIHASQLVLVMLTAAKEVEALHAGLDGVPDTKRLQQKAYGERPVGGVEAAIVEQHFLAVLKAEGGRYARPTYLQEVKPCPVPGCQAVHHGAKEGLHLAVHKGCLFVPADPVKVQEVVHASSHFFAVQVVVAKAIVL